jgi:hypothetical protein
VEDDGGKAVALLGCGLMYGRRTGRWIRKPIWTPRHLKQMLLGGRAGQKQALDEAVHLETKHRTDTSVRRLFLSRGSEKPTCGQQEKAYSARGLFHVPSQA